MQIAKTGSGKTTAQIVEVEEWGYCCRLAAQSTSAALAVERGTSWKVVRRGKHIKSAVYSGSKFEAFGWRKCVLVRALWYTVTCAYRIGFLAAAKQIEKSGDHREPGATFLTSSRIPKSKGSFDFEYFVAVQNRKPHV